MRGRLQRLGWIALLALPFAAVAQDGPPPQRLYDVTYEARLLPSQGLARVRIRVASGGLLHELRFPIDRERYFRFGADGTLHVETDRVAWSVPAAGGELRYSVKVDHLRDAAQYDARLAHRWALFRGSDLFPPSGSSTEPGAHARARLRLRVPPGWSVLAPFPRDGDGSFRVEQEGRRLDRPAGWMLMGARLRVRRAEVADMQLVIAGPDGQDLRARDQMALLRWTLPHLRDALGVLPERLLVVGADDPMWRGGLSGPSSLYLHADRPLIEHDGTSPLLHELVHVATHAVSGEGGDWIVEGLAEYYSLELLRRSGSVSEQDHADTLATLRRRAEGAGPLRTTDADAAVTARAVGVLIDLDRAIREHSDGEQSLDDVARSLAAQPAVVTPASFRERVREVTGADLAKGPPFRNAGP